MRSLTATKVARCLFLPGLKSRGFQAVCTSFLEIARVLIVGLLVKVSHGQ